MACDGNATCCRTHQVYIIRRFTTVSSPIDGTHWLPNKEMTKLWGSVTKLRRTGSRTFSVWHSSVTRRLSVFGPRGFPRWRHVSRRRDEGALLTALVWLIGKGLDLYKRTSSCRRHRQAGQRGRQWLALLEAPAMAAGWRQVHRYDRGAEGSYRRRRRMYLRKSTVGGSEGVRAERDPIERASGRGPLPAVSGSQTDARRTYEAAECTSTWGRRDDHAERLWFERRN